MSTTVVKSSTNKKTVYNPKFLVITPFSGTSVGDTKYLLQDVVRDSVSINQDEAEENAVENEFSASPIINNIIAGKHKFAASIGDMQSALLKALMGYSVDAVSGKAYAPSGYVELFARIELVFQVGNNAGTPTYLAVVLPKVQLNAAATIESINSSVGSIAIAGVAFDVTITDGTNTYTSPMYVDYDFDVTDLL